MKLIKHLLKISISLLSLSFLVSCSDSNLFSTNESFDSGYAQIILTQGTEDEIFEFKIPIDESDQVYAKSTSAADNAALKAYLIQAKNGYEKPFEAFSIKFVPSQVDSSGNTVSPYATVVFTESTLEEGTSDFPMSRTFYLNSTTNFSISNYSISSSSSGKISFDWAVDDDNSVKASQVYSNYEVKSYRLKSVKFVVQCKSN